MKPGLVHQTSSISVSVCVIVCVCVCVCYLCVYVCCDLLGGGQFPNGGLLVGCIVCLSTAVHLSH